MNSILNKSLNYFLLHSFLLLGFLFLSHVGFAQNQIEGIWKSSDGEYMMKITSLGEKYQGRIVWSRYNQELDSKNPNEKLSRLPIKGSKILDELTYLDDQEKWISGTLYIPSEGKNYQCEASINGEKLLIKYFSKEGESVKTWTWIKQ